MGRKVQAGRSAETPWISPDDFMSKCFEENIECTELVLQIVLGRDDLKVEKVTIQHQLKNL